MQKFHFIAIGGAAMHNLALALQIKGYHVTGSDDAIFEPSRSRLEKAGILPVEFGWFPSKIDTELDAVILGMHAREDNPELARAKELGIKIFSYPEFLYEQTKDKKRVVIGGSHGKTSVTAMIMHVLRENNFAFDYMVGSQIDGFERMVSLSEDTNLAVFEGDEYLSSPIDLRPKFHLYKPHIAVINGIAWDHINVFPNYELYFKQFEIFMDLIEEGGTICYYSGDKEVDRVVQKSSRKDLTLMPYQAHKSEIDSGTTFLILSDKKKLPLIVFGEHNLQNISAAYSVCISLGISSEEFYKAISTFKGTARRLQLMKRTATGAVYYDFAHSPSKVSATVASVRKQFPQNKLIACFELHTFSSLNKYFLEEYKSSMIGADIPIVYYNPEVIKKKGLGEFNKEDVFQAFNDENLQVFTDSDKLKAYLQSIQISDAVFLLMSSGNFGGLDISALSEELLYE